ncbi:hypothetical protein LPJ63_001134 [Coemansia sp. RSA 2711]|nr:hypothetical protein LPJ63_001134 [Coemansia sp. RSA 2711]
MSIAEKAIVYATLILADDNVDVSAFEGRDVNELLLNVGSAAAAAPAAGAAAAGDAPAAAAAEEKKEESEEESDDDMGFGLFD